MEATQQKLAAEQAARADAEQGTTGIIDATEDGNGMLEANAITYADGLLATYSKNDAVFLTATTELDWFDVGMQLPVFLPQFGLIDENLFITKITTTAFNSQGAARYQYAIEATNGPNMNNWAAPLGY